MRASSLCVYIQWMFASKTRTACRGKLNLLFIFPNRPALFGLLAQAPLRHLVLPSRFPLDIAYPPIRLTLVSTEQHMPALQTSDHLFSGALEFLCTPILQFSLAQWFPLPRLFHLHLSFFRCQTGFLFGLNGYKHVLYAP